ncbi:hypothetical protein [Atopomonas hussainii]|uniref:hypothetical protein n=1 Tax=Atopomonas hussainii TaxID=1429083 RepID=UPI001114EC05|nr:hypothetical protein [Atopomonas hussainii]
MKLMIFMGASLFFGFKLFLLIDGAFDRDEWVRPVTNQESAGCYRGAMVEDLIARHLFVGMRRSDVVALLGQPDYRSGAGELQYVLGMCSGVGFDYDYLNIYFDGAGGFVSAKVFQH